MEEAEKKRGGGRVEEVSSWKRGWEATSRPTTAPKSVAPTTNHIKGKRERTKIQIKWDNSACDIVGMAYGKKRTLLFHLKKQLYGNAALRAEL